MLMTIWMLLLGYAFGNITTGDIVGKVNHVDIRHEGSGNVGSTNAMRTMGFLHGGLPTLIGDMLKAIIPACLAKFIICRGMPGDAYGLFSTDFYTLAAGYGAVLGHNFPAIHKFKGGKGVASTFVTLHVFKFPLGAIEFAIVAVVVAITRYVSLGSILGFIVLPLLTMVFFPGKWALVAATLFYTVLGVVRHHANISRLMSGTENKFHIHSQKTK